MRCLYIDGRGRRCSAGTSGGLYCERHGGERAGEELRRRRLELSTDPDLFNLRWLLAEAIVYYERFSQLYGAKLESGEYDFAIGSELREWLGEISRLAERAHRILYGERYVLTIDHLSEYAGRIAGALRIELERSGLDAVTRDRVLRGVCERLAGIVGMGSIDQLLALGSGDGERQEGCT